MILLPVLGIGLVVVAFLLVLLGPARRGPRRVPSNPRRDYAAERAHQPPEIATGRLVLSEYYLRTELPRRLGARVDQVYLTANGDLVPVDTKVRFRREVRPDDLIGLSVQAAVLRHTKSARRPPGRVANWGYVRVAAPDRAPVYLRTHLLDDEQLSRLYERYFELAAGAKPGQSIGRACRYCPKLSRCRPQPTPSLQEAATGPSP